MIAATAALTGSAILASIAVFTYFGGYWYQLWKDRK